MINKTIITIDDLRSLAPGTPASIDSATIIPYLRSAHKAVSSLISVEVFNEIADLEDSELLHDMKSAVSNRLMYDYKLFEIIQLRQTGKTDTYKYEFEAMQNTYLNFYYDALDSLFAGLHAESCPVTSWKTSAAFKARERLLIKNTEDFHSCYGIDNSDYFFFSVVFIQRMVIDKYLTSINLDELSEDLLRRLKCIVAKLTVAYALRQFDITMFPKSLRNPSADGASRQASSEQESLYKLSEYLFSVSEQDMNQLLFELQSPEPGCDLPSQTNLNDKEYKFFLMS